MAESALARRPAISAQCTTWRTSAPLARLTVRGEMTAIAAALAATTIPAAVEVCRAATRGEWAALWLGPDEQLLLGPEQEGPALATQLDERLRGLAHAVVDVGHRQGAFELTGAQATPLLNSGCPLDLRLAKFPVGMCTRTVLAKAEVVLWRRAPERFHLEAWRSFGPYLAQFFAEAEKQFVS
ncbi:MAG TPA: sarcosine oxidase subunit gamma family protein [Steroidobacteraceae bacterium]